MTMTMVDIFKNTRRPKWMETQKPAKQVKSGRVEMITPLRYYKLNTPDCNRDINESNFNKILRGMSEDGFAGMVYLIEERSGKYIIIDGQHRILAAMMLNYDIPCYIIKEENLNIPLIDLIKTLNSNQTNWGVRDKMKLKRVQGVDFFEFYENQKRLFPKGTGKDFIMTVIFNEKTTFDKVYGSNINHDRFLFENKKIIKSRLERALYVLTVLEETYGQVSFTLINGFAGLYLKMDRTQMDDYLDYIRKNSFYYTTLTGPQNTTQWRKYFKEMYCDMTGEPFEDISKKETSTGKGKKNREIAKRIMIENVNELINGNMKIIDIGRICNYHRNSIYLIWREVKQELGLI